MRRMRLLAQALRPRCRRRVLITGGPALGQFRNDGTLGSNCSRFNLTRTTITRRRRPEVQRIRAGLLRNQPERRGVRPVRLTHHSATTQQVAPSGVFGYPYFVNMSNPFIGAQARGFMITEANKGLSRPIPTVYEDGNGPLPGGNWKDVNRNGVVDTADELNLTVYRRTLELGPRSTSFSRDAFQLLGGVRGDITDNWNYDVFYQYGQSNANQTNAGYTNVSHIEQQLRTVDGTTLSGVSDPQCVPINLFGGYGTISPAAAKYARATALQNFFYEQLMVSGNVTGTIFQLPWADRPIAASLGADYRSEKGSRHTGRVPEARTVELPWWLRRQHATDRGQVRRAGVLRRVDRPARE